MHNKGRFPNVMFGARLRPESAALAVMVLLLFLIFVFLFLTLTAQPAQAQTFQVIHNFTGGADGATPNGSLAMGLSGDIYGTTVYGGVHGNGAIFEIKRRNGPWVLTPLYNFADEDGQQPSGGVTVAPNGVLYGATMYGGSNSNGTVFSLSPIPNVAAAVLQPWNETVLHSFTEGGDGYDPSGSLLLDGSGNIYGTTMYGGPNNYGIVYQLTPSASGWTESILYGFGGSYDGDSPNGGVISDKTGNLYGTTVTGRYGYGIVYELSPSGSGWAEQILRAFQVDSDGGWPRGNLIFDQRGNLYGTTSGGGPYGEENGGGTVFELTPSNGSWTFSVLHSFQGGSGPQGGVIMDASGSLCGTTMREGAYGAGTVFKLSPSGEGWTYSDLHDFTGIDGSSPERELLIDSSGNMYGTTTQGGAYGYGVVFEITP